MASPVQKEFTFEAIAFVSYREDAETLGKFDLSDLKDRFLAAKDTFAKFGFTDIKEAYAEEDDGQEDEDIKFFVGVKFVGPSAMPEYAPLPAELVTALGDLVEPDCTNAEGMHLMVAEDWELISVDELE